MTVALDSPERDPVDFLPGAKNPAEQMGHLDEKVSANRNLNTVLGGSRITTPSYGLLFAPDLTRRKTMFIK